MLFSDDRIANFINHHFEPTWENVREVPIVSIDFGGGRVVRRTLNGNIATYVCNADGNILDILPGIYEPISYQRNLDQLARLHRWVVASGPDQEATLRDYHGKQAEALAANQPALALLPSLKENRSKRVVERPLKLVLRARSAAEIEQLKQSDEKLRPSSEVARWKELAEDTRINESQRRLVLHQYLARGMTTPAATKVWMYRDVLDADLEDPYLGLGKVLFASYPFSDKN